jgi:uncharacterized cupredoxin-like copper-binding protein
VSIDGEYVVVAINRGGVYVFKRDGTVWAEQDKIGDIGNFVAINGDYIIVGNYGDDNYKGAAYLYSLYSASVTPNSVAFGDVVVGSSRVDSVKVKNSGMADLSASAIAVTGADAGRFTATPSSLTLAAGDSAYVKVTFTPASVGTKTASLKLTHNAPGSPTSIPLAGTGLAPSISTSSFLTFGDVALVDGIATVTDSIKIKNTGTADLTVNPQNNMGGGFTVSPTQLTVAPGDSVKLAVVLSATTAGRKDAALVLNHNDADAGGQTTIAVHANVYERVEGAVAAWGYIWFGFANINHPVES